MQAQRPLRSDAGPNPQSSSASGSLAGRLLGSILAAVLVLSVVAVGAAIRFARQIDAHAIADTQSDLTRLNLVLSEQTASIFQSIDLVLVDIVNGAQAQLSRDPSFYRAQMRDQAFAGELRARRSGLPQIEGLILVAEDGIVLNASRAADAQGSSVADRGWFQSMAAGNSAERMITAPIEDHGTWKVLVLRRISAPDGGFAGVVICSIALESFEAHFRDVRLGRSIGIGLWREDSTLLVRYPADGRVGGAPNPLIAESHHAVLRGNEAGVGRVQGDLNAQPLLLSVRRVRGLPLYMTVSLPEEVVAAQTYSTGATVIGATIVMTLAIWFVGALGLRQWRAHLKIRDEVERRRAAESHAIESEARFRDGIESMGDGFLLWDRNDRVLTWNAPLIELLPEAVTILRRGLSRDEFVRHVTAVALRHLSEADRLAWQEQRRLNREQGNPTEVTNDAGRRIRIRDRRTSEGGCVSTYVDITSETEARQRAEAGEAKTRRMALVAQHMHGAVTILDEKSRISWCNPAFTTMSGYAPEEALGRTPRSLLFGPMTSEDTARSIATAVNAGRHLTTEMIYYRKDGATFDVEVDVVPILDSAGRIEGVIGVHIDVTERNRQAAVLAEALATQREVSAQQRRFISIVSHEFRTPITIIDGATQVLQRKLGAEAQSDLGVRLDRIRRAVARMTDLVERTLQSARLDEGRIEMRSRPLDLRSLIDDACARQRTEHPDFEIAVELSPEPEMIDGDPVLLDQVVTNLLSNAIKYSGDSRRIEVSLSASVEGLALQVRDYGIGVEADELPRLFDRFYRTKSVSAISGVGIGLHLVRELVVMHGGEVGATSSPGKGSTFTVRLPRTQPECSLRATG